VASLAATGNPNIWTFTPTVGVHDTYLIELLEDTVPVERRIFAVRTVNNHLRVPAFNEQASRHASLDNHGADQVALSDDNATDYLDATLNTLNYSGYWRSLRELYKVVEAGTGGLADHGVPFVKLPSAAAAPSVVGASANGNLVEVPLTTLAGAGLAVVGTGLDVTGSTSITIASDQVQRAAITGVVNIPANSNAAVYPAATAKSLLANATNASAVPAFLAGTAAFQYLRVNSANNALEMATLSSHASTTITYTANTFVVALGADFAWTGWHSIPEWASHGAVSAGVSAFWAKNTAPTTPMFTDDDGNDWPLAANAVASMSAIQTTIASTTTIVAASFTAPAGSWRVGTLYKVEGYLVALRGATATASNVIIELLLGGTVFASVTIPITPSGGGSALVTGYVLCLSTGAGGTFIANIKAPNDLADLTTVTAATIWALNVGSSNTAAFGTTKSTAATQVVQLQARMSVAVSALSITWTSASIVPVK
jgi:hypothetical protein